MRCAAMAVLLAACSTALGAEVLVEAESFADRGGWVVDQQFMDQMGSPYLLAHGLGQPVANAVTEVEVPRTGGYWIWVRTKDWVPGERWSPGRFRVHVGGGEYKDVLGTKGGGKWHWRRIGAYKAYTTTIRLELEDLAGFDGRCDCIYLTLDPDARPPQGPGEEMDAWRRRILGLPEVPPDARPTGPNANDEAFDVVVVGGGIAGCSAAVAAARLGCRVALVQDRPVLGGNNSVEVRVHTGGRSGPVVEEINGRYSQDMGIVPHPARKASDRRQAVVDAEPNITQFLGWHAFRVGTSGDRIEYADARQIYTGRELRFRAAVFIDCTGDGSIGYWAGADFRMGREARSEHGEPTAPETADRMTLGTSVRWGTRTADAPVTFPDVPWATAVSKDHTGTGGDWTWEYGFHQDTIADAEAIRDHLLRAIYGTFATTKRKFPEKYANLELVWVAYVAGKRESRRLLGDYVLTENDIKRARQFPDAVATGSWSIDLHYPRKGLPFRSYADQQRVEPYPIPFRCLYSRNVENLMMAGRDISATHVALGSTRVMNTCGQLGVATGVAAYLCKRHGTTPRGVSREHLAELKEILGSGRLGRPPRPTDAEAAGAAGPIRLDPPGWLEEAGKNVARGANIAVSGHYDAARYPAANLNDGRADPSDNRRRWLSARGLPATVELAWDEPRTIAAARVVSGYRKGGGVSDAIRDFRLEYHDGGDWRPVPGASAEANAQVHWTARVEPVTTRRARLVVTASPGGVARIWEIELYGPADGRKEAERP